MKKIVLSAVLLAAAASPVFSQPALQNQQNTTSTPFKSQVPVSANQFAGSQTPQSQGSVVTPSVKGYPSQVPSVGTAGAAGTAGVAGAKSNLVAPPSDEDLKKLPSSAPVEPATSEDQKDGREGRRGRKAAEEELSPIERAFLQEESLPGDSKPQQFTSQPLLQFGYSFFREDTVGFAPLLDAPVGADYVVGPGDRLVVTTTGSIDGSLELEVNRSGEIVLPKVGAVKVAGATFGQLPGLVKAHLGKVFKDFQVNVTMGKLRLIKVYIVGEVKAPGDYSISSLSTVINSLSAAGGPTKNGSLRNIQIKRGGKTVETVDLYDFFLKGDKSSDIRLQPGDTVYIPVVGPLVGVAGNVRRPAFYELKGEKNLREVLTLADGIIPSSFLQRIQVSRVQAHEKRLVADYALADLSGKKIEETAAQIPVQDQDIFRIFQIDQRQRGYVRLEGYVLRPGDYALKPGIRIADILTKDNLLFEFYEKAAEITRLMPPDYHPEKLFFNLGQAVAGEPEQNLELKEFDTIKVFSRWELEEMPKVRINGEVQKPGEFRLYDNMTIRDLVFAAGNAKRTAYLKSAEITRLKKDGESVSSYSIFVNLEEVLKGNREENIILAPYDEVNVRTIPNWVEETERYITLKGEVYFPGIYPVYRGERLSSVIERAGGFTERAYLRGAKFTREAVRADQQKRMDEMLSRMEQEVLKKQTQIASAAASKEELESAKAALEGLQRQIDTLKTKKAEGRLVINLSAIKDFKNSLYDIEIAGGDALYVPQTPNSVNIMGSVYNPTTVIHMPNENVSFYLQKAGGPTRDADRDDMYLIRADGTVLSKQQTTKFFFYDGFLTTRMEAGDTIVVPQEFQQTAWMRDIKDIATILGQIAVTAGVVFAAGL